jgi:hypothetical protein
MSTSPLGSTTATQVAITVPDIEQAVAAWARLLGVPAPEVIVTGPLEEAQTQYCGRPSEARAKLAFFSLGSLTLELIEPLGAPSTWNDHLVAHGPSLHHIAFQIQGMPERVAVLAEHGLPLVQKGEYTGGRYAYLDGQRQYGAVIELLEND